MIAYHYVFKNPIGASQDFIADWNTELRSDYTAEYVSAIPLTEVDTLNPAEVIHFKDGTWKYSDDTALPETDLSSIRAAVFTCTSSVVEREATTRPSVPWSERTIVAEVLWDTSGGQVTTPVTTQSAYRAADADQTWLVGAPDEEETTKVFVS